MIAQGLGARCTLSLHSFTTIECLVIFHKYLLDTYYAPSTRF